MRKWWNIVILLVDSIIKYFALKYSCFTLTLKTQMMSFHVQIHFILYLLTINMFEIIMIYIS